MKRALVRMLKALLPVVIVAAAGFAAITMILNRPPVETLTPVVEPPGVRVHEVTLDDAALTVTSQGTVRPRTESQLVPEIAGRVTWVAASFAEGGFFEAGDVLVRIDPFDYEQMLVSARSQLAQARLRLAQEEAEAEVAQREWDTLGRGDPRELALRKPQLDDARASVAAAEASVERATRDLERAEIVAPYAGRVRTKNVDIGQYVRVGDALATVYSVDVAEIRLPLPDDELAYLDLPLSYRGVEQRVQPAVTLRATFAGETHAWNGRIVRTESEIDSVSRMVHAVAEVADPYAPGLNPNRPPLAVGMYVEAEISGRTVRDVAVLPRQALRGRDQVLVVTPEDRLAFRTVDVLRTSTASVIVRAGLQPGELVVISPLDTPTDGMRVQLADAAPDLLARRAAAAASPYPTSVSPAPVTDGAGAMAVRDTLVELEDAPAPAPAAMPAAPSDTTAPGRPRAETATPPRPAPVEALAPTPPAAPVAAAPPVDTASAEATTNEDSDRPAWLASLLEEDRPAGRNPSTRRAAAPQDGVRSTAGARQAVARQRSEVDVRTATTRRNPVERRAGPAGAAPATAEPAAESARRTPAPTAVTSPPAAPGTPAVAPAARPAVAVSVFTSLNRQSGAPDLGPALGRAVVARLAADDHIALARNETDARYVVRGGIQQIGPLVRVTARIVDAADGTVLHAAKIDGTTDDRPSLEADVAAAVVERLAASLASTAPAEAAYTGRPTRPMRSALAVLPFDDLSGGAAAGIDVDLGAAIAEAVTERLATLPAVAVVTPGDEAAWSVDGGIQRIGSLVRVTARLTDVRSGVVLTAVKVDGTVEELADLQSRVAGVMMESVRDALAAGPVARSGPEMEGASRRREGRRS